MIFILIFYLFKVDDEEVKTVYKGQTKELNIFQNEEVNLIQKKKQHIKFLNKEIHYKELKKFFTKGYSKKNR